MKKILLTFVGEQDPISEKTNEEGSIVTLVRHLKPDIVYMFPTVKTLGAKNSTDKNARDTEDWIKADFPQTDFICMPISTDPTDYTSLLTIMKQEVKKTLKQIQREFSDSYELHANCSSGTPQMKTTWLIFANTGLLPRVHLWQVANPQFKTEDRITEIQGAFIEEENIIVRAQRYAQNLMFYSVIEELAELFKISIYHDRRQKAELLKKVFEGYARWDLIQYKEAYEKLNSARGKIAGTMDMKYLEEILDKQLRVLSELKRDETIENTHNLVDLIYNAKRRFHNHQYTEVLARFWRIYEGVLYCHLLTTYGVNPRNLKSSTNKNNLKKLEAYNTEDIRRNSLTLYSADTILSNTFKDQVLAKLKKETVMIDRGISKQEVNIGDTMNELRITRNDSIVAHGMTPVSYLDANKAVLVMDKMLNIFFEDTYYSSESVFPINKEIALKTCECLLF